MQERKRLDVTVVYLHQAFISFAVLYKRGFVMFGVVSLTMGNSHLPSRNRLGRNIQFFSKLRLSEIPFQTTALDHFSNIHSFPPFSQCFVRTSLAYHAKNIGVKQALLVIGGSLRLIHQISFALQDIFSTSSRKTAVLSSILSS